MLNGRFRKLAFATAAIATALGFTGLSATSASAAGPWHICDGSFCIQAGSHNQVATVKIGGSPAALTFLGPFQVSGSNASWWEIEDVNNGMCLALNLNNPPYDYKVYWETCIFTDQEEYWDNHPGNQFENAAGNLAFLEDTWLIADYSGSDNTYFLTEEINNIPPIIWSEPLA